MNARFRIDESAFRFGEFELVPARRLLSKNGRAIKVGSRALDLLAVLVESAGMVVTKDDLMSQVWANVVVEEANLRVQVFALRRALGDDGIESRYIVHVARRGYVFIAPVAVDYYSSWRREELPVVPARHNLPLACDHPPTREVMAGP